MEVNGKEGGIEKEAMARNLNMTDEVENVVKEYCKCEFSNLSCTDRC